MPSDPRPLIYMDCSATTPVRPEVMAAMRPYFDELFGNASGAYSLGRKARGALETARMDVARVMGCAPAEVVFTSGGSESDNLALRGVAWAMREAGRGNHVVTTAIEHEAVLATAHQLEACHGFEVTVVGVDGDGRVDPEAVLDAVRDDTAVVSVMLANNEVGTLQPIAEIGAVLRERGVPFHTDAVQAASYADLDVETLCVDLLSLSAHKFYGPKGVGVLYVRAGTPIATCQTGGGQEGGRRSGTQNVAGAVGFARALVLAAEEREEAGAKVQALRDTLIARLTDAPGIRLTGHPTDRLPSHASFCIEGTPADAMLLGLDMHGICASSGSACSAGKLNPSHVLTAMGVPAELATGALRFSLGRMTRVEDVQAVIDVLPPLVERLRGVRAAG